jgi:dTDP-4-dehydrorhamnose reductase
MRILIIGGSGMLGTDARQILSDHEIISTSTSAEDGSNSFRLDITNYDAVISKFREFCPELVIHTAAYTNVEGCERDPEKAFRVNAYGTWCVASATEDIKASLVAVSTDFVFDGSIDRRYTEFDAANPLNAYGASKYQGEVLAQRHCSRTYIVRTSWLFGVHGKNFVYTILNQALAGKPIAVVADQTGCPTYTVDLAHAIKTITSRPLYGIYHVCNDGVTTWHDFARAILDRAGYTNYPIERLTSLEAARRFNILTKRPLNSALKCGTLELLGLEPPRRWESALDDFFGSARLAVKLS